jgi:hypothetical protein
VEELREFDVEVGVSSQRMRFSPELRKEREDWKEKDTFSGHLIKSYEGVW